MFLSGILGAFATGSSIAQVCSSSKQPGVRIPTRPKAPEGTLFTREIPLKGIRKGCFLEVLKYLKASKQ